MNSHQILIIIVDTRILGSVADSLQDSRFAGISPTNYKDTEESIFLSEVMITHCRSNVQVVGKWRDCVGTFAHDRLWPRILAKY